MDRRSFFRFLAAWACLLSAGPSEAGEGGSEVTGGALLPSRQRPLVEDPAAGRLHIYTEANLANVMRDNPHWGVVSHHGTLSEKGILRAFCKPADFYDALVRIGARPGNNLTEQSTGRFVGGDRLSISASVPGMRQAVDFGKILLDSAGKGFNIRFGGNRTSAEERNMGCITCLESCWVGITSNDRYPLISGFRRFMRANSVFRGNPEFFSGIEDRPVILTYRV